MERIMHAAALAGVSEQQMAAMRAELNRVPRYCVHCGVELVGPRSTKNGPPSWSHVTHLNRCQSKDVPYGHEAHPAEQECPPWCAGSREHDRCPHRVDEPSTSPVGVPEGGEPQ